MLEMLLATICLNSNPQACQTGLMAYYEGSPAKTVIEERTKHIDRRVFIVLAAAAGNDILFPITNNISVGKERVLFSYGF